jgi:hypothetical protein
MSIKHEKAAPSNAAALTRTVDVAGEIPRIPRYNLYSRMQSVESRLQRIEDTMVTKADMERMRLETKADMERMRQETKADMWLMFGVTVTISLLSISINFYNTFFVKK